MFVCVCVTLRCFHGARGRVDWHEAIWPTARACSRHGTGEGAFVGLSLDPLKERRDVSFFNMPTKAMMRTKNHRSLQ